MKTGILYCFIIALLSLFLGEHLVFITAPILALLIGILLQLLYRPSPNSKKGIQFTTKKLLQIAIVLLGFGLNLQTLVHVSTTSFPIIAISIIGALLVGYVASKFLPIPKKLAILISVGTSICGGSAIAATAPVIDADETDIAQAMSVIFLFNLLATIVFPYIGQVLHLSHQGFAIFAGTAVNDTSSVTAVSTIWDNIHQTGHAVLDMATVVKLTRTLAIIPIVIGLSFYQTKHHKTHSRKTVFPMFIVYFILASLITTILHTPLLSQVQPIVTPLFTVFKQLSKLFIVMTMAGVGLLTPFPSLIKTGRPALTLGLYCWGIVILCTLGLQALLHLL